MEPDTSSVRPVRRRYSKAFKAQILRACSEPGASLSGIAIAHDLNPNMVQRWRREARRGEWTLPGAPAFIPVVASSESGTARHQEMRDTSAPVIDIRLQRGALQARLTWPAQDARACAAWLRVLAASLMATLQNKDRELARKSQELLTSKTLNEKLSFEIAQLHRFKFGRRGEHLPAGIQGSLLEEALDEDLTEIEAELKALAPTPPVYPPKGKPRRTALAPELPRVEIRHEPHGATCACGCQLKFVRDEVTEKLDYTPGTFTVERHVRPILACPQCETITQAPMPPYVIDKGLATPGLLAHVLVAKYVDHLPLNRQEGIFARAGLSIARSTLVQSAKLNGHDPHAYLKDVLTRLPTQPNRRIAELLPHRWQPA